MIADLSPTSIQVHTTRPTPTLILQRGKKDFALIIHREPSMGRSRQKWNLAPKIHHDPFDGAVSPEEERLRPHNSSRTIDGAVSPKRKDWAPQNTSRPIDGAVSPKGKTRPSPPKYATNHRWGSLAKKESLGTHSHKLSKRKDFALIIHREPSTGRSRQKGKTGPLKIHHDPSMGQSRQKGKSRNPQYVANHRWGGLAKKARLGALKYVTNHRNVMAKGKTWPP